MNLCILLGKIINEIEFKFMVKSKNKSIAYFDMQLLDKSIVRIKSYDEVADYVYRKFKTGQIVLIEGIIRGDGIVEAKNIFPALRKQKKRKSLIFFRLYSKIDGERKSDKNDSYR